MGPEPSSIRMASFKINRAKQKIMHECVHIYLYYIYTHKYAHTYMYYLYYICVYAQKNIIKEDYIQYKDGT